MRSEFEKREDDYRSQQEEFAEGGTALRRSSAVWRIGSGEQQRI